MSTLCQKKDRLMRFTGAMAASLTPFDSNGEVNVSQIPAYLKFLVDNSVDGVFINGTTGEGYSLTYAEKLTVAKSWREAIDTQKADLLTVVSIATNCPKEAVAMARELEAMGFDAIAFLPPTYYKPSSVQDWVSWAKLFADAAPNTPLAYYHNQGRVGNFTFDIIDAIDEGLKQIPQLTALKFADDNAIRLSLLHKKFQNKLKIIVGLNAIGLTGLTTIGCEAGLCTLFTFPTIVQSYKKMIEYVHQFDMESARKEQDKIIDADLVHIKSNNYFLSLKTAFNEVVRPLGMDFGFPRPPVSYHYKLT